ncbi:MAG: hypothetical protein OEV40_28630, partial [Acidimicrobiia bacterium]|nr:hypothetical protein [Acidimicrobiia bacterium]
TVEEPRVPAESAAAPTTTAAPVTTVPPTTAPVPVAVDDQATLTAGEYLTQNITGNALRFSYVEPGNVLHGWHDFYTIAYCTDGSTAVDYYGERTTILDNKEYDSSYDIGQWFVDDRGGGQVVLVHDYGYSGLPIYGFVNAQGQLLLDPGWSWQVLGPAGC